MSLFFEERIKERLEDPANDKIVFTHPWIIEITPQNKQVDFDDVLITSYRLDTEIWKMQLSRTGFTICAKNLVNDAPYRAWNGSSCYISYNLYYDADMRFLFHSTPRIKMIDAPNEDTFQTPDGFMKKFVEAFNQKKISKVVIHIELHLPLKWFHRPFEKPKYDMSKKMCEEYPADLENNFKFLFLKMSDYSIKCRDGTIPALKIVLNISSTFMTNHFKETNGNELTVDYSMDVVKPIIYYLHSLCFEMPKSYDLEYVHRLFEVMDFFTLDTAPIRNSIHQSLCRKFVEKATYNFESLLRWLKIVCQNSFFALGNMIVTIIADKYFFKWNQIFPENARNNENPIFFDVFGPRGLVQNKIAKYVFLKIELISLGFYQTNVILP